MIFYDSEIEVIDKNGILLRRNGISHKIEFDKCTEEWQKRSMERVSNTVGERDITTFTFTFYDNENVHTKIVVKRGYFWQSSRSERFGKIRKKIFSLGFTTKDLS